MNNFESKIKPTWCPGCGNYGILTALKQALTELKLAPTQALFIWDIGCSGNMCNWLNVCGIHALHGRTLPVATGAKLVNPKLTVIAQAGDGGAYGIGLGHLIHTIRRNTDITYIVHNNQVYGLTAGQPSPTANKNVDKGSQTKLAPCGVQEEPINPLALALSTKATFVARGFAGDIDHLKNLIIQGIKHPGFALIDVLQPCVTFNKAKTYQWFRERIYELKGKKNNRQLAIKHALEDKKIPIGLFYQEIELKKR